MKNPKTKIRNKADKLLQDYIRLKYKNVLCYGCGERKVEVGHHYITKANSNALRYYEKNIVPLCKKCHCLVHAQPHLIEPKICFLLGEEWYNDLLEVKRQGVKANLSWYQDRLEEIERLIGELK